MRATYFQWLNGNCGSCRTVFTWERSEYRRRWMMRVLDVRRMLTATENVWNEPSWLRRRFEPNGPEAAKLHGQRRVGAGAALLSCPSLSLRPFLISYDRLVSDLGDSLLYHYRLAFTLFQDAMRRKRRQWPHYSTFGLPVCCAQQSSQSRPTRITSFDLVTKRDGSWSY